MAISSPTDPSHWLRRTPIAHRGLHQGQAVPENSLSAFQNAVWQGCPIELDVQILTDRQIVVFHDSQLERVTGESGLVSAQTAGSVRRRRLFGTVGRVPLLDEVLMLVNGSVPLLIEIKSTTIKAGALERKLLSLLAGYTGEFALQSFNPWSFLYLRKHAPAILRGHLSAASEKTTRPPSLRCFQPNRPPYWMSRPHFVAHALAALPCTFTDQLRASGMPLLAWTIRTATQKAEAQRLADNYIFEEIDGRSNR